MHRSDQSRFGSPENDSEPYYSHSILYMFSSCLYSPLFVHTCGRTAVAVGTATITCATSLTTEITSQLILSGTRVLKFGYDRNGLVGGRKVDDIASKNAGNKI